jgi:hypothetical protein
VIWNRSVCHFLTKSLFIMNFMEDQESCPHHVPPWMRHFGRLCSVSVPRWTALWQGRCRPSRGFNFAVSMVEEGGQEQSVGVVIGGSCICWQWTTKLARRPPWDAPWSWQGGRHGRWWLVDLSCRDDLRGFAVDSPALWRLFLARWGVLTGN